MQDFPGNSARSKARSEAPPKAAEAGEERPTIERVTTAEAVPRRSGLGKKFKNTFVGGSARDAVDYMIVDVVVPAVRDTIVDALQGGIERLFNGDNSRTRRPSATSSYSSVPRVDYTSMSRPSVPAQPPRTLSRRARTMQDFGDIIVPTRREADEVIDQMFEILSRCGDVKVADLYDMVNIKTEHTDHRWGWTSLQGLKPIRTRDNRFMLDLPEPIALG
jgi:hypothetical protein